MTHQIDDHDRGLSHDLPTLIDRRAALGLLGGGALAAALAACSGGDSSDSTSTGPSGSTTASSSSASASSSASSSAATASDVAAVGTTDLQSGGTEIPEETNGPYPADGSNGVNILTASGIVRSDVRSSFGTSSTTAAGVPLTVVFRVVDVSSSSRAGKPVKGAAVYMWQCDRDGNYSMYSDDVADENYLRGVQATDRSGRASFTSIFPACYQGRWPHIHFEVYPSLGDATKAANRLRTSQLAFPKATCDDVYATDGYEDSVQTLSQISLERDGVFSDGYSLQLATMTGSVSKGYTATLRVPI